MRFAGRPRGYDPRVDRWRAAHAIALFATVIGCKGKEPAKLPPAPAIPDALATANAQPGSGVVTGSADGTSFTDAAAFVIESPDVESTTVIYIFSKPVRCLDLSFSEWDRHLPRGTTFLALKINGPPQRQLNAVKTETPGPGEAVANYARSAAPEIANETRATGGTVTLMAFVPRSYATVSFSLAFGRGPLIGDITAAFCPGGHEP
jgi:hypothetical protein